MIWNKEDSIFLLLAFGATTTTILLYQAQAINRELLGIMLLTIIIPTASTPIIQTHLQKTYSKIFAKDLTDYWADITDKIWRANQKHQLYYNLNIPEGYVPQEQTELPEIGLSIHTIKTEDTTKYGTQYADHKYPEKTIIYNTKQQKILTILPLDFDQTINWLKNNKSYFTKESTQILIPQTIKELSYGQPIKTG